MVREVSVAERSRWLQWVLSRASLFRRGVASMLPHRLALAVGLSSRLVRCTSELSSGDM